MMPSTFLLNSEYRIAQTHSSWSLATRSLFIGSALLLSIQSLAQNANPIPVKELMQELTDPIRFDVNSYNVLGNNPLSKSRTKAILASYTGQSRGIDTIENAAQALESALAKSGYSFFRVSFPQQELSDGDIELLITQYKIGSINVKGNRHYTLENIEASLPVLRSGQSPSTKGIARALRVANQNAGKQVRVSLSPGRGANEVDANIVVKDIRPISASIWLNNTGTDVSGDYRVGASIGHRNLFGLDHNVSLSAITSPEGVDEVQQFALSYDIPLYSLGGRLNFVAVNSNIDTGVVADVFDVAGKGEVYGIGYSHVLSSIGPYNHGLNIQVQDKLFDNDITFQSTQLLDDVRSRPISLGYQGSWRSEGSLTLSGSVNLTSNLSGGQFNNADFYQSARLGATDDWSKAELGLGVQKKAKGWLFSSSVRLSQSSDRLITGEQFSVGGTGSVRGLEERELRGDEGYQLNVEAWAPPIYENLRPILFFDYGRITNNSPIVGEIDSESVASLGFMLNWNPSSYLSASMSFGYLLDGIDHPFASADSSEDGDSRLNFNVSYRY